MSRQHGTSTQLVASFAPRCRVCPACASYVVRRGEDGDDVFLVAPVVALHDQLVRARHQRETVVVVELLGDVLPECVAGTAGTDAPAAAVVGIGPQEVALTSTQTEGEWR